ncbi:hypothetical protein BCV72DRAFT_226062 [Rhizopus microsporus var. microsporus]|uniref:CCHC-type domain-containing protein n=1 Tax=Rhizopus microsporus var. microsporus TaxID=86635 RepID=A0A1X0R6X3_RHIZD|nr:hypothetical protein BCV72DRAFT_226062 [Rhizopus microsporus var. microsporus]
MCDYPQPPVTITIYSTARKRIATTSMAFDIKPLNLQGGQCTWCGKYGHKRPICPLLK